jgi:alpha-glucosidase
MLRNLLFILIIALFSFACSKNNSNYKAVIPSPNAKLHIYFELNNGEPYYMVYFQNEVVVNWSSIGLITNTDSLTHNLSLINTRTGISSEEIDQGLSAFFDEEPDYNDMLFTLTKTGEQEKNIEILFRAYNDGIAFRYINTTGNNVENRTLLEEASSIRIPQSHLHLTDTLYCPSQISMTNGITIEFLSQIMRSYPEGIYILDSKDPLKYNLIFENKNDEIRMDEQFLSPWRVLRFSIIEE